MSANVERGLMLLKGYALFNSLLITGLALSAFTRVPQRARFDEIDVGRINVVEKDGTLRLVISNREQSPGPIYRGKPFGRPGGDRPGMIFFNEEGTENGGMTWGGRTENGKYQASGLLAFDQYQQDQAVFIRYDDDNGRRIAGLMVTDQPAISIADWIAQRDSALRLPDGPEKTAALERLKGPWNGVPAFAQRVFAGRDRSSTAVVSLGDRAGRPRLRLSVDSLGTAQVEFLDETGRVTYRLPEEQR